MHKRDHEVRKTADISTHGIHEPQVPRHSAAPPEGLSRCIPVTAPHRARRPPPLGAPERVVRVAGRRPGRVLAAVAIVAGISAVLALRLEPSTAVETLVGRARTPTGRPRSTARSSATTRSRARPGRPRQPRADRQPRAAARARGLHVGQQAEGPGGAGRARSRRARSSRARSRSRSSTGRHVHQLGGRRDQQQLADAARQHAAGGGARRARRRASWPKAQGRIEGASRTRRRGGRAARLRAVHARLLQINLRYGLGLKGLPRIDDPDFVSALVFDPSRGATTPKARFAYLFPNKKSAVIQVRLKPNLTRAAAAARDRARAQRGGDEGVAAQERGELHGDRRAGAWSRTSARR